MENVRGPTSDWFFNGSSLTPQRPRAESLSQTPKTSRARSHLCLSKLPSKRVVIPYFIRNNASQSTIVHALSNPLRSLRNRLLSIHNYPSQPQSPVYPAPAQSPSLRFGDTDPVELHPDQHSQPRWQFRRQIIKKPRLGRALLFGCPGSSRIESKITTCLVSGILLALTLTIYLILAVSDRRHSREFHVLLMLIILLVTIFFGRSLVRVFTAIINPPTENGAAVNPTGMVGPHGYANPAVPVQVVLACDEEAAGIESRATKMPPPVYGLWRDSMRVDPNRLFWQRNNDFRDTEGQAGEAGLSSNRSDSARPPSYISDDGVNYVIEAIPRRPVPSSPLSLHRLERGR